MYNDRCSDGKAKHHPMDQRGGGQITGDPENCFVERRTERRDKEMILQRGRSFYGEQPSFRRRSPLDQVGETVGAGEAAGVGEASGAAGAEETGGASAQPFFQSTSGSFPAR